MYYIFTNHKRKVFLLGMLTLLITQVFAQRGNQTVISDKNAPREFLNETNKEELMNISRDLENQWISRRKNVEEFARKNNIEIRQELPNGRVIQLVDVENGKPWFYTTHNSGAATTTRASHLWSGGSLGLNLDGSSLPPIGVWDAGAVLSGHQEFTNGGNSRITQKDNATAVSNHATHVSGTLIASGVTAKAKGMASNAKLYAYDWSNDASEMAAAAAEGMLISSHSYGYTYGWSGSNWYGNTSISTQEDYRFGFYSTYSRTWDNITHNAPYYLIVKSAGNDRNEGPTDGAYPRDGYPDGFDCIGTDAIGKNILTVGSVFQVNNYTQPSDIVLSTSSGCGPADDGRIKPDVVGKGSMVYSSTGTSSTNYATMSGTSMSTPNVAGTLALLQEYYMQLNGSPMRSSTLKALTIHTTDEAGPAPGPDYMFGWGLVNAERAAQLISANQADNISIQELTLVNNGSYQLEVYSDGTQPLKATIVWTDPAGKALSPSLDPLTPALVNDLDLLISGNNSSFYPWKLNRDNPGAPATRSTKNFVDNVEVVLIDNPAPGAYTIKVTHDGTLSADQAFSLVVSGAQKNTVTTPVADFSADKTSILVGEYVQFNNLSTNNPSSYKWEFAGAEISASSEKNPKVKFISEGTFTVKLTATNSAGSNTKTKTGYITVKAASVKAEFTASVTTISEGGSVNFTDQSLNNPTSWSWTFQGGTPFTSTAQHPSVSYSKAGVYDVTLTASNASGTNQVTKSGYISVIMKAPVAGFTASATEITTGGTVQFTDQSQNAQTFAWTFEGGTPATSTSNSPLVTYNTAGTYTVTQKVTNSTGNDTKTVTSMISVKAPAVSANFSASTTSVVEGGSVLFTDITANNPTSWSWTFAGGTPSTSTEQNPTVNYSKAGVYDVTLTASNANGTNQVTKSGYISVTMKAPVAGFTASATEITTGGTVQFTDQSQNAQTFAWTFEGGTPATSNLKNPLVTYNAAGTYTVTQKVANSTGNDTKTVISMITVKAPAVSANFSASSTSVVEGGSVLFTDLSSNNPTSWSWTFAGGTPSTSTAQNPSVNYSKAGVYDVTLTASNANGTNQVAKSGYISVTMKAPVAGFTASATEITTGGTVQFTDQSQNAQTFAWTFEGGAPATSTSNNPLVTYNTAGTYTVTQKVTNSTGNDTKTVTSMITVKAPAVSANFTVSTTSVVEGASVSFTDLSANNPTSWLWTFDGGTPSTSIVQNPAVSYSKAGVYDVTLEVTNADGSDQITRTGFITVVMKAPLAGFTADKTEIFVGESVQFTDQSQNALSYSWNFDGGDPSKSIQKNALVTYKVAGTYAVSLKVTNSSGSDTKTVQSMITVNPLPVSADFTVSETAIIEESTISFTDLSKNNPTSWSWTLSGGTPSASTAQHPKVTYSLPGTYDVTLKVTNADGTDLITRAGYITVVMKAPVAGFTASVSEIFVGESVQFTDQSQNAQSYAWSFDGGTPSTSNLKSPSVTYNTAGTFAVSQKVINTSGSDTKTITGMITVKPLQVDANFTASVTSVTEGSSVSFTDLSVNNPTSWSWTITGGTPSTSTAQHPNVTYSLPGTYDVTLKVTNADGTDQITRAGYIAVAMKAPVAGLTADKTEILVGESVQFTDQSQNAQSFAWTFEGGTPVTSTSKNPLVTYNTAGTYTVTQKVTNSTGNDTKTVTSMITVKAPAVIANFTASSTSVVEGGSVSFTDISANNPTSWSWTFNGGTPATSIAQNPTVIFNVPGVYDVTLQVSNGNSTHQIVKTGYVSVAMKASEAGFTASVTEIFVGESVQFTDQSQNAQSYAWSFEGGTPSTSNLKSPSVTYNTAGTYTVSQKVTNTSGSDTKTVISMITVKAPAVGADLTASSTSIVEGGSVSFTDISANNPTSWLWTFNGGTPATSAAQNPIVTYNAPGVYDVTLQVSNGFSTHQIVKSGYIAVAMKAPVAGFTASATGITTGGAVQFTDQSQNAQSYAWTFEGGTPATSNDKNPLVTYNNSGSFNVKLTVSNTSGSDDITYENYIKVENSQESYPLAVSLNASSEWINSVSIGNFTNKNSGPSTYSDFTDQKIILTEGLSYSVTLIPGYSGPKNPLNWKIWIDYNNDLDFDDEGEEIFSANNSRNNTNGKILIPNGSAPLLTRMRVAMRFGDTPLSWGTFTRGEVEDYTVEIITSNSAKSEDQGLSLHEPAFKAYPNPARDNLFIQLDNWEEPYEVRITDLSGRVVYNQKSSDNVILVDVSRFNKGLYILTVSDGKNINSQRITVH